MSKDILNSFGPTNCTYTSTGGQIVNFSVDTLLEIMANLPDPPKIYTMDINVITNRYLSDNTIIISKDIADIMEEEMEKAKTGG